jgi:hypothetical protein
MNFEVNGIAYFLTYDSGQAQWFLLRPAEHGFASLEIHSDHALPEVAETSQRMPGTPRVN